VLHFLGCSDHDPEFAGQYRAWLQPQKENNGPELARVVVDFVRSTRPPNWSGGPLSTTRSKVRRVDRLRDPCLDARAPSRWCLSKLSMSAVDVPFGPGDL
jgi:hypothetical protein